MATLDPEDWSELRALGHRMIDDMFDRLEGLGAAPSPSSRSNMSSIIRCPSARSSDQSSGSSVAMDAAYAPKHHR